jgi:hypothetical protein
MESFSIKAADICSRVTPRFKDAQPLQGSTRELALETLVFTLTEQEYAVVLLGKVDQVKVGGEGGGTTRASSFVSARLPICSFRRDLSPLRRAFANARMCSSVSKMLGRFKF